MSYFKLVYLFILNFVFAMGGISQNVNWIKSYPTDAGVQTIAKDIKSSSVSEAAYVCGYDYATTLNFGLPFVSGPTLGYFMKVNDKGDTVWLKHATSNTTTVGCAFAPTAGAVDASDNFYAVGWYSRSAPGQSFYVNNLTFSSGSAFIIKFDSTGEIIWSKDIATGYCNFNDVDVDRYGNIYVMGSTRLRQIFGNDTIPKPTVSAGTNYARDFIVSYDSSGNVRWAKGYGEIDLNSTSSTTEEGGFFSIAVDKTPSMNVFVCGLFHNSYTYQGQTLTSFSNENGMLLRLDSLGRHIKNMVITDSSGRSVLTSIDINDSCSIAIGGIFTLSAVINGNVYNSGSSVSSFFRPFIAKLDSGLSYKWVYLGPGLSSNSFAAIDKAGRCAFYRTTGSTTSGTTHLTYLDFIDETGTITFTKAGSHPFTSTLNTTMYPMGVTFSKFSDDRLYCLGQYKPKFTTDSIITVRCKDTLYQELLLINIVIPDLDTCRVNVNIGNDTTYCSNFNLTLDAGITNASYQWWYNGTLVDTNQTVAAKLPGLYKVSVMKAGCQRTNTDSIYIEQKSVPAQVNLGLDTIGCNTDSVVLYSNNTTDRLIWNNKIADTARTYSVKKKGNYWLKAYNICGSSTDTVHVEMNHTPTFTLGNDTTYCSAFTRDLKPANIKGSNYTFLWSTGQTSGTITVNTKGKYWCRMSNNCGIVTDTVQIFKTAVPRINLGADIIACDVSPVQLDANDSVNSLLWNGSATDTQRIYTVTKTGNYWLKVYNSCGTAYDTIDVTFGKTPQANLGNDTTICNTTQLILNAISPGDHIKWNGSSQDTGQSYSVTKNGKYSVWISNICGISADDITVNFKTTPVVNLGNDTFICSNATMVLNARNNSNTIAWMGDSTLNTQTYTVLKGGTYWVNVSNVCGVTQDSMVVTGLALPVVNLGPDKSVKLPFSSVLDASNPGSAYRWSTSAADTLRYLTITQTGLYWVDVANSCGTVRDSILFSLNTTGIAVAMPDKEIHIYPNPARSIVYIYLNEDITITVQVKITDIAGKTIVSNEGSGILQLDVSSLEPGLYIVVLVNGGNISTEKIVIEH